MIIVNSYYFIEVEEIVKESDTAFLVRFCSGETEWILKKDVASASHYGLGDHDITLQLKQLDISPREREENHVGEST